MKFPDSRFTKGRTIPLRISLIYALVGCLWIVFLSEILPLLIREPGTAVRWEVVTGWVFVGATAGMLYFLIRRDIDAIRKSGEALRESEEKFQMLLDNTASAIFIYRDKILHANPAMETLTGYDGRELLGMDFFTIVHPAFREEIRKRCEALSSGGGAPLRCEFKILRKGGEERWVDFTSSILFYGGALSGLGTLSDMTERKRAEEALRESEERLRLLVESVRDYEIFLLDPEGRIVTWNIGAERSKGYLPEEIIGKSHVIFFTGEDRERGLPARELEVAAVEGRCEDEGWRVRKDGSLFWANVVTTVLRDRGGHLRGYAKVIRDITERKRAEETLRESEERYRVIAETASDAIITIDGESRILFANPAAGKVFGLPVDELLGRELTMLMPERLRNAHLAAMTRYLATGKKMANWGGKEVPGLHRDGHEIPLEVSYGEFLGEEKHFFTGIVRDITERKQAEKEKEYQDMLERFSREIETRVTERTMNLMALTLADRVRNPASVIRLIAKRILEKGEVPERVREGLMAISDQGDKLEAIVKEFQSLLKSRESMFTYEDINEIVSEVLPIAEREARGRGVELDVDFAGGPLKINAQKDLVKIAVYHLLRNAIEATAAGGRVALATWGDGNTVILSVSDTGQGIPEDVVGRIFDPLFSTKTRRFGMGLPLLKQIVSEHMGSIDVESGAGKGTTFRLRFPVRWSENRQEG